MAVPRPAAARQAEPLQAEPLRAEPLRARSRGRGWRAGCRLRALFRGQLRLQPREICVLQRQQALGFGELAFQIVHAALQGARLAARGAGRCAGGGRLRGGYELQPSGLRGGRFGRCAAAAPGGGLAADLGERLPRGHGAHGCGIGHTQHRARAQQVHVLLEGMRVLLVDREHPAARAVGVRAVPRCGGRNARERLAAVNHVSGAFALGTAGRAGGGGWRCRGGRRSRCRRNRCRRGRCRRGGRLGGRRILGAARNRALARARAGCRCADRRARRRRLPRGVDRRIEQHGVFAHQPSVRPVHLDEQRNKRVGDRIGGLERDDGAAIGPAHGAHLYPGEVAGPVKAIARESVARGELRLHRVHLVGGHIDELDLRIQRRIERRQKTNVSQTQGKRG